MNLIKKAIAILIVLTVCLTPIMASADENVDNKKVKILMLGNSLFYANSMDTYIFPEFCKAAGKDVEITSITESGTTLYRLASSETSIGKKALAALENNVYDYVILNPSRRVTPFEYSVYHAEKQAALYLNSIINAMGAKTLLAAQPGVAVEDIPVYTMSESGIGSSSAYTLPMDRLTNQIYVENLCNDLCSEMKNAEVVRVGAAAETIISEFPDFNSLYNADNRHPSTRGSYLQAACYYAAIFKESPVGVNFVYSLIPMNAITVQRAAAISVLNQDKSILKTEVANRVLSGKLVSNTSATLNWTEPKSADYYNIYRKDGHNSYVLIGRTVGKECSYTDKTLKGGNTYYYRVKPVHKIRDLVYESDYSNTVTVKTLGKVKVTSIKLNSAKSATIKFNSVDGAAKYRIYRKKTTGKSYSLIAKTKKTSYTDKSLKLGKTYDYVVVAQGSSVAIQSEKSNVKSVAALNSPKATFNAKKSIITVKVSPVKYAEKYSVYYKKSGSKSYKLLKTSKKTSVTAKKLSSNTKYNFRIVALKGNYSGTQITYTVKTK